jgi:hypothetical protein
MQIENTLTNRQLYKKAYLIEFYEKDNLEDVFTFSIPPESEELTYPQRKTETKTMGGLHVDDYGVDAVKVTLSGSTINQSTKRIYGGEKPDKYLSGEDEIYELRDLILKHKSLDKLVKGAKTHIYDLSKFTGLSAGNIENYWQAFIGDFKIRRASDRPFTYKYTFEFTGVPLKGKTADVTLPKGSEALESLKENLDAIKIAFDSMNRDAAMIEDAMGYVDQVSELLNDLGSVMSYSSTVVTNTMGTVGKAAAGVIEGGANVAKGINTVISLPQAVETKTLSIGLDLQNATNKLMKSTAEMAETCRDIFDSDTWKIPQETLHQFETNNEEFKCSLFLMLNKAENSANELAAYAKSSEIPDITKGNDSNGVSKIVLSYGYTPIILKDSDSLESLALRYLGDPDKAIDIATFNSLGKLSDLIPGDIIRIPITKRSAKMRNNLIFAKKADRDNYGKDILLDDRGFTSTSNTGDYKLSKGVDTLTQAVLLRLKESVSKRVRLIAYGIKTNVSEPAANVAITSSAKLTVESDPRVDSVDRVQFKGKGDSLDVKVFYRDVNSESNTAAGRM